MTDAETVEKLTAENIYWFKRARLAEQAAVGARVQADNFEQLLVKEQLANRDKTIRLALVTDLQRACHSTGYVSEYHWGGVTSESLESELEKAKRYELPTTLKALQRPGSKGALKDWISYAQRLEAQITRMAAGATGRSK